MKGLITAACLLTVAVSVGGRVTWSAFHGETANEGNTLVIGTVAISDDAAGSALFTVAGMRPGDQVTRCIAVDYTGTAPAEVRLYGATTAGTGLERFLHVTVVRGANCAAFTPAAADHRGLGPGVVFSGLLSEYPATQAAGVVDPTAQWTGGSSHAYRISVDLDDSPAAENLTATQRFTWSAH